MNQFYSSSFHLQVDVLLNQFNSRKMLAVLVLSSLLFFTHRQAVASNTPPTINLATPVGPFTDPATIVLSATASDSDGTIKNVKFYNGSVLIGTATSDNQNNYTFTWTNVSQGVYSIRAKATDNAHGKALSSVITVTVQAQHQDHTLDTATDHGTRYLDSVFTLADIKITKGIVYGSAIDNLGNPITLTLDVYEPNQMNDPERHRPLILLIHGGGFVGGQSDVSSMVDRARDWFARRGYVAASINYRLRADAGNEVEDEIRATSDAQAAVRFFRAHAADYHIDPNRICTYGRSAGAITSEFTAISSELVGQWETLYPTVSEDVSNPGYPSWIAAAFSEAGRIDSDFLVLHLDSADAATVVDFHGTNDLTVPYPEAVYTIGHMAAMGIYAELFSYNANHLNFNDVDISDIQSKALQTLFDRVVKGDQCPAPSMKVPQIPW